MVSQTCEASNDVATQMTEWHSLILSTQFVLVYQTAFLHKLVLNFLLNKDFCALIQIVVGFQ